MSLVGKVFAEGEGVPIDLAAPTEFFQLEGVSVGSMVSGIISFLMIIASFIFFVMLVLGGVKWIMSEGDESKVKTARDQVQNALVGLVVVFSAWAIMKLIETVFGVSLFGETGLALPKFI